MGIWAGAAQHGLAPVATPRQAASFAPPEDRKAVLEALAARVEDAGSSDWELDLDIYGAFGFPVRRKLARGRGRNAPGGGIYQQGLQWKAVGHIGNDLALIVDVMATLYPHLAWSLRGLPDGGSLRYRAEVAGSAGMATAPGRALCAAALRAAARETRPWATPGGVRPSPARQAC